MIDRKGLNFWTDKENKVEAAHLLDLCENALEDESSLVTPFLSPGMAGWLENVLKSTPLLYKAWGGFEDAERVRFVLEARGCEPTLENAQVSRIQATPQKKSMILGHRDVLGSIIGLGLERSVIGDIRQGSNGTVVAVTAQIQDYILQHWSSVGKENIEVSRFDPSLDRILPLAGYEKRVVAASPRLDNLAATGFGVSRSTMQDYISQGMVKRNNIVTVKPDADLRAGDIISCRSKGRFKVLEEESKTRKGRFAWRIFIYSDT